MPPLPIEYLGHACTVLVSVGRIKSDYIMGFFVCLFVLFTQRILSIYNGLPGSASGKEPACQCRRLKKCGFSLWIGKIPWSRAWQPTLVFLPEKSHEKRSLAGCSPWGCEELDLT